MPGPHLRSQLHAGVIPTTVQLLSALGWVAKRCKQDHDKMRCCRSKDAAEGLRALCSQCSAKLRPDQRLEHIIREVTPLLDCSGQRACSRSSLLPSQLSMSRTWHSMPSMRHIEQRCSIPRHRRMHAHSVHAALQDWMQDRKAYCGTVPKFMSCSELCNGLAA